MMTFLHSPLDTLSIDLSLISMPHFNILIGAQGKKLYWASIHRKNEMPDPKSIIKLKAKSVTFSDINKTDPFWTEQINTFLTDKPIDSSIQFCVNGTDFQVSIWKALLDIPYGKTTTYQQIATQIGRPKSVRATGSAIGKNPISLFIPCHRVIGSNKGLCGYAWGLDVKQRLLDCEK
jgi:O-6-methylguanine DNA methyltransferase